MSKLHANQVVEALAIGAPEGHVTSLADFDIPEAAVLELDAAYTLDPDGSYCPLSDIPDFIGYMGVYERDGHAYVVGDNGNSLFMFRFSK